MTTTETEAKGFVAVSTFEGHDVVAAKIEIPNAAGGLRDAMEFEPVVMEHGDEVYIALHCRTKKVRFDPESKEHPERLVRVHVLEALNAAFIDESLVGEHLRVQQLRLAKQREEAEGIQQLGDSIEDLDRERQAELVKAHDDGLHTVSVVDCVACEERDEDRAAEKRQDLA